MTQKTSATHEIVLSFKKPNGDSTAATREAVMQIEAVCAIHDMLCNHWAEVRKARRENGDRLSVALTVNFNDSGESPEVRTTMGFASRFRDSREAVLDIGQELFDFSDGQTPA